MWCTYTLLNVSYSKEIGKKELKGRQNWSEKKKYIKHFLANVTSIIETKYTRLLQPYEIKIAA